MKITAYFLSLLAVISGIALIYFGVQALNYGIDNVLGKLGASFFFFSLFACVALDIWYCIEL